MAKAVTLSDIGKKLNVSTVTVSKALSGQKGVSDELRAEIVKLADEMGYIKKTPAMEGQERNSYHIGVIVAERYLKESQSFYWKIYQEISQRAMGKNCFTILEVITLEAERECQKPILLEEKKVDGFVVIGTFQHKYADKLALVSSVPVVFLDTTVGAENGDFVVSNNLLGGYLMTNYLFDMGHRKIGFVGTRLATPSIDDRFLGYYKSLMEHGIALNEDWLIDDREREFGIVDYQSKFVLPKDMPTAFFCNCDLTAGYMIRKLEEAGYRVPEDISVAGYDNYVNDQLTKVGITTYEINIKDMAKRALHILINKMSNSRYSTGMFMISGKFVERDSVKGIGPRISTLI